LPFSSNGVPLAFVSNYSVSELIKCISGKKVSCSTRNFLFTIASNNKSCNLENSRELDSKIEKEEQITEVSEWGMKLIKELACKTDLYLITECMNDSTEHSVLRLFKTHNVFQAGLKHHKALFSSSAIGRMHMVRQLEPYLHIDDHLEVLSKLSKFVPLLLHSNNFKQ